MGLESCVRRGDKMEFRGTLCTLYVHKHKDTSPKTISADAHKYDDDSVHGEHDAMGFC